MKSAVKSIKNICLAASVVIFSVLIQAAWGRGRIEPCYVEVPVADNRNGETKTNYFFDGTGSVGGFVQPGKETEYIKTMFSAVETAETLKYGSLTFYRFWEKDTSQLTINTTEILKEIQKPIFYNMSYTNAKRKKVIDNNEQPFASIVDYIKGNEVGNLNVIVTDLYEPYGQNRYFHLLFQNAFDHGLAGAIFAIKGEFKGSIYNISTANDSLSGVEGFSTFFLLITGDKGHIKGYCGELSKQLTQKGLSFNRTLFIPGESANDNRGTINYTRENNPEKFGKTDIVNLRLNNDNFRAWVKNNNEMREVKAGNIEAYIPGPPADAQYVYRIRSQADTASALPVVRDMTVAYFDGSKANPGNVSPFKDVSAAGLFEQPAVFSSGRDKFISMRIHTKQLQRGYYRVKFNILPSWILDQNARNIAELKESNVKGGRVKVLNLRLIYENIMSEFVKAGGYSEIFYIVKN